MGGQRLYVAQDHWSIHRHPDVALAVAGSPRITPVWLPTEAPWLNRIEQLWWWLRQDQLYVHRLAPRLGAVAAARQWLLGSVCAWLAGLTPLCRVARCGQAGWCIAAHMITDLGRQNSSGSASRM